MTDPANSPPDRVTGLHERPRRPGRFVVTLASGTSFTVSAGALADAGATRVGAVVSPNAVSRLASESRVQAAMDRAMASLARGRRSRRELEQRLRRLEPDATLVHLALDRLYASGVASDDTMAIAEASARLRRGEAPLRVQQRLRQKGIEGALALRAVRTAVQEDQVDEAVMCRHAAERRMRSLASLEPTVARRRLIAHLTRRGFSSSVIIATIADHFASR